MGILADRWETVRNDSGWLADDDRMLMGPQTRAGVRVNRSSALGLTTVWRCWSLLSAAISQSPRDVILKVGGKSFPEFTPPTWLTTPNPDDPTFTGDDYFAQIVLSYLSAGEYFTRVFPYVLDPQRLVVIDPALVDVRPGPMYDIKNARGQIVETVGPMEMLHGKWMPFPGALRGMSPLEAVRLGFGAAIASQDHAARFFGQGTQLAFGVEVPGAMDKTKRDDLKDSLRTQYAGPNKAHTVGVLSGGAKFVSGLAPTPDQAQFLETRKFGVEEICRIYGVPPGMVGSQEPGASSYASADVYRDDFRAYSVQPLATAIERQHSRLLELPLGVLPPATVQFRFNLDAIARTNLLARYQAHAAGVQGGFLKPREARAFEDLPALEDGSDDQLFMQRQMVPLKDLGTTAPIPGAAVDASLPAVKAV